MSLSNISSNEQIMNKEVNHMSTGTIIGCMFCGVVGGVIGAMLTDLFLDYVYRICDKLGDEVE